MASRCKKDELANKLAGVIAHGNPVRAAEIYGDCLITIDALMPLITDATYGEKSCSHADLKEGLETVRICPKCLVDQIREAVAEREKELLAPMECRHVRANLVKRDDCECRGTTDDDRCVVHHHCSACAELERAIEMALRMVKEAISGESRAFRAAADDEGEVSAFQIAEVLEQVATEISALTVSDVLAEMRKKGAK